jgi:hypothetical protein
MGPLVESSASVDEVACNGTEVDVAKCQRPATNLVQRNCTTIWLTCRGEEGRQGGLIRAIWLAPLLPVNEPCDAADSQHSHSLVHILGVYKATASR